MSKKHTILELFAGVGGLSEGFKSTGSFQVLAANEILPKMAEAYRLNHPEVPMYACDIKDLKIPDLMASMGVVSGELDLLMGGPPCQAFSTAGKRSSEDPRATLYQQYYRFLQEFNPKMFVFENVKGLLSIEKGDLLRHLIQKMSALGYAVQYRVLNAAAYGVPQFRERLFIIGTRLEGEPQYPAPTHGPLRIPYVTLEDAIGDLPFIRSGESSTQYALEPFSAYQKLMRVGAPLKLADHNSSKNAPHVIATMAALPEGGTPKDIAPELRPSYGFANIFSRLWWGKPSTTITRNLGTPSSARCIHPKTDRALTTREGARLQSFPDRYHFYGSRGHRDLQIGNAVPPLLAKAIAQEILVYLQQRKS